MFLMTNLMSQAGRTARALLLRCYSVLAYAAFAASAIWAIGFLADLPGVPGVDRAGRPGAWLALVADLALLGLFAIQHTVMARRGFKRRLAAVVPAAAERSTYVLVTSLVLLVTFWQWQPWHAVIWRFSAQPWAGLAWGLYAIGWVVAVAATFMVNHLDFLGLKQAGWRSRRRPYEPPSFTQRWLYRWVRHPMMTGLIVAFWATPSMTAGHLVFAAAGAGYILVGIRFEERDLRRELGEVYLRYARQVPALVPLRLTRVRPTAAALPTATARPPLQGPGVGALDLPLLWLHGEP
jgi:methanethiol S-methyltransferase